MGRHQMRLKWICVALGLVAVFALTACGGGSSSSSSTSNESADTGTGSSESGSGGSEVKTAQSELAALLKGEYGKPDPKAPEPKSGVSVWGIYPGFQAAGSKIEADEFKAGAEELGWKATNRDGKYDPSVQLAAVREAVRANADAIWLEAVDCEPIKAGLEEAKAAGIIIVASNAHDCSQPVFTAETEYVMGDTRAYAKRWGEAQAIWAIANTNAEAKVLQVYENDLAITKEVNEAAKQRFEKCAGCEIVGEVTFTGSEIGPPLQQKVEQALLQYPEVTVVNGNYDAAVELGIAAAVRSSGKEIAVLGGEGQPNNVELVRNGEQAMGVGYPIGWVSYSALDAINRLLAGEKSIGNSGAGIQVYDAEHNLPPAGQAFSPPIDYRSLYQKAWGLE